MKKLMLAAAIVCAAVMAQASMVKWQTANFVVDKDGVALKSSAYKTISMVVYYFDADGKELGSVEGSINNFGVATASWAEAELSTTYYAKAVFTDKDGDTLTSEKAMFTTSSSVTYQANFSTGVGFATSGNKFDQTGANYGWSVAPVPEPTSGLLMLLGMAGLALKRKRA